MNANSDTRHITNGQASPYHNANNPNIYRSITALIYVT